MNTLYNPWLHGTKTMLAGHTGFEPNLTDEEFINGYDLQDK
jgi:hypothetical protein